MRHQDNPSFFKRCLELVIIAGIYYITARIGQKFAIPPGNITPVWIPSGIMLAAVLVRGYYIWPGIFLGAFLANTQVYFDASSAQNLIATIFSGTANSVGDVLSAVGGAYLIRRTTGETNPFGKTKNVIKFILFGALVGPAISAFFGVTSLCISGFSSWYDSAYKFITWWTGDAAGVLLVAPAIIVWMTKETGQDIKRMREKVFFIIISLVASIYCLGFLLHAGGTHAPLFMIIPVFIWGLFRFGRQGAFTAVLLFAIVAISATVSGHGPFIHKDINRALIDAQLFLAIMSTTVLILGAVITEYRKSEKKLHSAYDELEIKVEKRTRELAIANERLSFEATERKRAEENTLLANERLRYLLTATSAVIYTAEPYGDYKVTFVTENFTQMTGYKTAQITEDSSFWITHIHPEDKEAIPRAMSRLIEFGISVYEYRFLRKDGAYIWLRDEMKLIRDERGRPMEIAGYWVNVTVRKDMESALSESEEKYRKLVENANDAILLVDAKTGGVLDANRKMGELLGLPIASIRHKHHTELYPEEERHLYRHIFEDLHDNGPEDILGLKLIYLCDREGNKIPAQISTNTIMLKGKPVVMGIIREISQFLDMVDTLREDKLGLKKAVSERDNKLRETLKELENTRRLSDIGKLAATIAHELRNPLSVIRTAVFNIRSKKKDAVLDSHIDNIEKKIIESDRIINNLLSYSRITIQQRMPVSIVKALEGCVENCKDKYRQQDVAICVNNKCLKGGWVDADPVHINELFSNIIDNAYQSISADGGKIEITVNCDRENRFTVVKFQDNGVGINKKDLARVYDPFFTKKARGIGLGLTVCHQIVELHGGNMDIESEEGKGTTVTVSLPFEAKA